MRRTTSTLPEDSRATGQPLPRRRNWLLVTLRRTLFWLVLLGGVLYAGQLWWMQRGGQPSRNATPVVGTNAASSSAGGAASDAVVPVAPPSAPAANASTPERGAGSAPASTASASTAGVAPAETPFAQSLTAPPATLTKPANDPLPPSSAASTPAISPVTDAEIAELAARKLLVPVNGIQPAQLQDTYTQSRGSGRLHEAIDIMAPAGTPVRAVENGRIVKVFTSQAGGLTLYQFDPSGRFGYYYAHLQGYADGMHDNRDVKRGDIIGYVGSTGNANPAAPHLHFAVFKLGPDRKWWRGAYLNPYRLWH